MTISYIAFKNSSIKAYWNNNGTILIIKGVSKIRMKWSKSSKSLEAKSYTSKDHASVILQPREIEDILCKGEFHYEGVRPGLLPFSEKIDVTTRRGIVSIRVRMFHGMPKGDLINTFSIRKSTLADIQKACKSVWKNQRTGIRPLIGLNSKAGSFDGMAGTLDQDKKNEEQRVMVKEMLKKYMRKL